MRRWTEIVIEIAAYVGVAALAILVFFPPQVGAAGDAAAAMRTGDPPTSSTLVVGNRVGAESDAGDSRRESGAAAPVSAEGRDTSATVDGDGAAPRGDAPLVDAVSLFPAAPVIDELRTKARSPGPRVLAQEVRVVPPDEVAVDFEAELRRAAAATAPAPKPPEPAPWLSYVGMVSREGTQYHYFKNYRTNRVIEAAVGMTTDGYSVRPRVDGTFVLSAKGRSYVVDGEEGK